MAAIARHLAHIVVIDDAVGVYIRAEICAVRFFPDHRLGGGDIVVIDQAVAVHVGNQNAERDRGRIELIALIVGHAIQTQCDLALIAKPRTASANIRSVSNVLPRYLSNRVPQDTSGRFPRGQNVLGFLIFKPINQETYYFLIELSGLILKGISKAQIMLKGVTHLRNFEYRVLALKMLFRSRTFEIRLAKDSGMWPNESKWN